MAGRARNPLLAAIDAMSRDGRRASIVSTRPEQERRALLARLGYDEPQPATEPPAPSDNGGVTGGLDG